MRIGAQLVGKDNRLGDGWGDRRPSTNRGRAGARGGARFSLAMLLLLSAAGAASAAEPDACDKYARDIAREQALVAGAGAPASLIGLDRNDAVGLKLQLLPLAAAKLEVSPERAAKDPASFAGVLRFDGAATGGVYHITLSTPAWIDVVQGGKYLKPKALTYADCPNARKSVQFEIGAEPFVVQLSDSPSDVVALVITPGN